VGGPVGQWGCVATGGQVTNNPFLSGTVGKCDIAGVVAPAETYQNQYNAFQGVVTSSSNIQYISFLGVPIDPPGSNYERIIRITNVRADATHVPVGGVIQASVSVSFINSITLSGPYTTVAFVFQGFVPGKVASQNEVQCAYPYAYVDSKGNVVFPVPSGYDQVGVTFAEGPVFGSSFKTGYIDTADAATIGGLKALRNDSSTLTAWGDQDLIGSAVNYYTESGFSPALSGGALTAQTNTPALWDDKIGDADYGTRFKILINNLQNGINLTFPTTVTSGNLMLQLISKPNSDGTAGSWASNPYVSAGSWTPSSGNTSDFVVYEVVADDPNLVESITVPAYVTYSSSAINLTQNIPALGANSTTSTSTITASFAPIAADTPGLPLLANDSKPNSTTLGSLPRFIVTNAPLPAVVLNPCSCNLLFPWIVNGSGFDTGLVIVNTSISPTTGSWLKGTAQSGTVTLWFTGTRAGQSVQNEYHPNTTATPAENPIWVPAGCSFSMVMSVGSSVNCQPVPSGEGGTNSTTWTTGFVGYIIATTTFQYCHVLRMSAP